MAESSFAKGRGKDTPELPERSGAFPALSGFKWKGRKLFQAGWHHEDVKFVPCKGMGLFYIFSARKGGSSFSVEGNYQIRYAAMEDIHGMSRVYVDTWKAVYQGIRTEPGILRKARVGNPLPFEDIRRKSRC